MSYRRIAAPDRPGKRRIDIENMGGHPVRRKRGWRLDIAAESSRTTRSKVNHSWRV